jgi:NTE family protein
MIKGKLLFDGGIYNNFPTDVLDSAYHPDYIIGVKVSSNSAPPPDDDVMLQIEHLIVENTNYSLPENRGILIEPIVKNIGLLDFQMAESIIDIGRKATEEKLEEIKTFIPVRSDKTDLARKRHLFKSKIHPLVFGDIYISGVNYLQSNYFIKNIAHGADSFTLTTLKEEYFKILADDQIESIFPRAKYNPSTGLYNLYLKVKREQRFKARIGGNISSVNLNMGFVAAEYKILGRKGYTLYGNGYLGRFYTSAAGKLRVDYYTRLPFYMEAICVYNRFDYFRGSSEGFYEDIRPPFIIQKELFVRGNIGFPVGNMQRLIVNATFCRSADKYYQTPHFLKSDTSDLSTFDYMSAGGVMERNTISEMQYPTKGMRLLWEARFVSGIESHSPGSTSVSLKTNNENKKWVESRILFLRYLEISKHITLGFLAEGLASSQPFFSNYTETVLRSPAFNPGPYSKTLYIENFRNPIYVAAGPQVLFPFGKGFHIRAEGYLFQPYREIESDSLLRPVYKEPFRNRHFMGSLGLIYHSPIGPVSLSAHYFDKEDHPFYLIFNVGFLIFNQQAARTTVQ